MARNWISNGTRVSFQYRTHQLLGGELVSGYGVVIGQTVVGSDDAYVVQPVGGEAVIHVRFAGVQTAPVAAQFVGMVDVDGEQFAHYTGVSL